MEREAAVEEVVEERGELKAESGSSGDTDQKEDMGPSSSWLAVMVAVAATLNFAEGLILSKDENSSSSMEVVGTSGEES